eukprot:609370-Rhodomonas_salina.1
MEVLCCVVGDRRGRGVRRGARLCVAARGERHTHRWGRCRRKRRLTGRRRRLRGRRTGVRGAGSAEKGSGAEGCAVGGREGSRA